MSTARQPEDPTGPATPQGSDSRQRLGAPAFVPLGLLALFLPILISLFALMPAYFVSFLLQIFLAGTGSSESALPVVLVLVTALAGLGVLAALVACLLKLARWPHPFGTTLLLLAAPVLALAQGPTLGLWFNNGPGATGGGPIGPVSLALFSTGMTGLVGYLLLAAVVLPLLAVQLWRQREARTGLALAGVTLALVLPLTTWYTLADLRSEAAEQIQSYTESIEAYPYPLAVLDSPDWRTWHLQFGSEHRSFTVVYINEDDAQLKLTTRPDHDPDCPETNVPVSPDCESFRVEVSGLNDGPSGFASFKTDATVHGTRAWVDLTEVAAEGYAQASADEGTPAPAALLEPADNPRESFLQGKTAFSIAPMGVRMAADHVFLLNPEDTEAVRKLAADAYLAT
ncbi:hypothetical protein [Nocardiopsis valliformis]|uniref:hypothetical protein n=1 Tax=Nocardiopsis valliformis TaxID=239974 RepID=UPI000349D32D|nr:hypothetical protein [Nocardiopsis valliformis]